MLRSIRSANILLAFGLELAMLAGFAVGGWGVPGTMWVRLGAAVALPSAAIVLWGIWAAPKAGARRLKMPALFWFKCAMFGAATAAWWFGGDPFIGAIFGTLAAINLLTAAALRHV